MTVPKSLADIHYLPIASTIAMLWATVGAHPADAGAGGQAPGEVVIVLPKEAVEQHV